MHCRIGCPVEPQCWTRSDSDIEPYELGQMHSRLWHRLDMLIAHGWNMRNELENREIDNISIFYL